MTFRILATGLLATTIITGTSTLAAAQSQSTDCDLKQSTASESGERQDARMPTRDDWLRWAKADAAKAEAAKAEAAKPAPPTTAQAATKLDQPHTGAGEASTTTGRASPGDRARKGADGSEAEANTLTDKSASSTAQSGGASSGARMGEEPRADAGNSAGGGIQESKSAERMRPTDC